ncbi:MAG TPA: putative Ig domain-containing protein, partial [Blastocatellia bacterium]|nr:putative Ig domain-containing protein [Blastocatellia bacterium]
MKIRRSIAFLNKHFRGLALLLAVLTLSFVAWRARAREVAYGFTAVESASANTATAEIPVYSENFEGTHNWTLNVANGTNGTDPNFWKVSDDEGGVAPPGCGVAKNGNKTLHVTSVFNPTGGASYDAGGLCGFERCVETNVRAESPAISTLGLTSLKLRFNFIANGDQLLDTASVIYKRGGVGGTWKTLVPSLKSESCSIGPGKWKAFEVDLPAETENEPDLKIGFAWTNNDDGIGTDPSVAIDEVRIVSVPSTGNNPPTIGPVGAVRTAGSPAANVAIANVDDVEDAKAALTVQVNDAAQATMNGVTVSNLAVSASGVVTANIGTTCGATTATFTLKVTDSGNLTATGALVVTVNPNTPPTLGYSPQTIAPGATPTITPTVAPSDNGSFVIGSPTVSPNNGGLIVSVNSNNGVVSVLNASLVGNYNVTIPITDNCNATTNAQFTVTVACPTITLAPASLPVAMLNTIYSQNITAGPAGGNYNYALISGALPQGLTFNSNGSFSGAPAQAGTFNFRVTATGFGGCTGFTDYVLTVNCPTITLDTASLPGGTIGTAYNQSVSASPAGSYSYTVTSGALPANLTLNAATGAITGMPTTSGTFNFTITATSGSCSGSRSYSVTITCAGITLSPTSPLLPGGQAGIAFSQTVNAAPAGSYNLSLIGGSLPSGLNLNPTTGLISGTPNTTGTFAFTVQAQAANGCSASQNYSLTIACPTVLLSPGSLPNGTIGAAYSQVVTASPAGGNYSYVVTTGSLPNGLNLNPATGVLNGTPNVAGVFNFRVTATGFGGCAGVQDYAITIGGSGCPTITLPAGLPNGGVGQLYTNPVAASPAGSYSYSITAGSLPTGVSLYDNFGLIYGFPMAAGSYTFTITATQGACTGSQAYTVTVGTGQATTLTVFSDFDGDGKSDLSIWRGSESNWLSVNSSDGQLRSTVWGAGYAPYNDLTVSGDYDGDGKTDAAVFRRGTSQAGHWYIKRSSDGKVEDRHWGLGTDVPVAGDYDGDGKTDIAVWRGSEGNWYIQRSSDGGVDVIYWGAASLGDVPVPGDYDGDGKTDAAVFRRSNGYWFLKLSGNDQTVSKLWGLGTDVPVAADYDGDGKTDIAVWRGSDTNWYIIRSSNKAVETKSWGAASLGDVPVPGDYDGDGKTDVAVWRESTGTWYVKCSSDDSVRSKALGQSGDSPVAAR